MLSRKLGLVYETQIIYYRRFANLHAHNSD